jgi:hypothetical protein
MNHEPNSELTSVIISDLFEMHLQRTIDNLNKTADGPIEIIVKTDNEGKGMRHMLNLAADEAQGEYLFKLDGHCIMTPHWDTIMKQTLENPNDMVVARIKNIDEKDWCMMDKGFGFVKINPDMGVIKCGDFTESDPDVMETMASIGCGWMIRRRRFNELEQNWTRLGRYGQLGAEWALKVWLSGGRVLVHRDVTCGHLFRKQLVSGGVSTEDSRKLLGARFQMELGPQQTRPLRWLADRFNGYAKTG